MPPTTDLGPMLPEEPQQDSWFSLEDFLPEQLVLLEKEGHGANCLADSQGWVLWL